jgi:hypothetical protein
MEEAFTLELAYKGITCQVPCTLRVSAYTYQLLCQLGETEIVLEKDDEGNLRAMEKDPFSAKNKKADPLLVRALIEEVERILL